MSYGFSRAITIAHGLVGSGGVSNFPILFSGTYSWLATVANGGNVQNGSGYDIIFTSDAAGVTTLSYERELYTASNGQVIFWIEVPSLSSSADTVIYIWYGNSSISTDQSNATGVWDSNFTAVYHGGTPAVLSSNDSTSNGNNLTAAFTANATGIVGGAFSVSNSVQIATKNSLSNAPGATGPATFEIWGKITGSNSGEWGGVGDNSANYCRISVYQPDSTHIQIETFNGGGPAIAWSNDNNWHYLCGVMPSGGTNINTILLYKDASSTLQNGTSATLGLSGVDTAIGCIPGSAAVAQMTGTFDEVRISKTDRSAAWITTTYNTIVNLSTFYSIGAPTGIEQPTDSLAANWGDAVVAILGVNLVESAVSDDQSGNWSDALLINYSILETEGVSDDQSGNWSDELDYQFIIPVILSDDLSGNWADLFSYFIAIAIIINDSQAASWGDSLPQIFGTSVTAADDQSPYWQDAFSLLITVTAGAIQVGDSLSFSDFIQAFPVLLLLPTEKITFADDWKLLFGMFSSYVESILLSEFQSFLLSSGPPEASDDQSTNWGDATYISLAVNSVVTLIDPDDTLDILDSVQTSVACAYNDLNTLAYLRRYLNDV